METKHTKDEWDNIYYPELSNEQNDLIREARRKGYADFYPAFDSNSQSINTLNGAIKYLANQTK